MALVVTALTIALAVANTSLLRTLKASSRYVDTVSAVLVIVSGLYLVYYFWVVDVNENSSVVTDRVDSLQRRVQTVLHDSWQLVAVVLAAIVVSAVVYVARRTRRPTA
jgi:threonine/homoserine/homoserine lactone efflux protein